MVNASVEKRICSSEITCVRYLTSSETKLVLILFSIESLNCN